MPRDGDKEASIIDVDQVTWRLSLKAVTSKL